MFYAAHFASSRLFRSLIALAAMILILVSLTAFARARLSKTKTTQQPASAAAATSGRVKIGAELITIIPQGFMPTNITRPKGQFFLVVDNRSGLSEVSLQLSRETGQRLKEVLVKHEALDWVDAIDLQPGQYVLTEAKHPAWTCRITITAK